MAGHLAFLIEFGVVGCLRCTCVRSVRAVAEYELWADIDCSTLVTRRDVGDRVCATRAVAARIALAVLLLCCSPSVRLLPMPHRLVLLFSGDTGLI